MVSVKELFAKRQAVFIEKRTKIEGEVDKFLQGVREIDPVLLANITPLNGTTTREVLPALWEEPFDPEAYKEQLSLLQAYIAAVKEVADKLNEEALRVLNNVN